MDERGTAQYFPHGAMETLELWAAHACKVIHTLLPSLHNRCASLWPPTTHVYRYSLLARSKFHPFRRFVAQSEGVTFETPGCRLNPRVARGLAPLETITVWTRRDARQLQRQLPPRARLKEDVLVKMTAELPAGGALPAQDGGDTARGLLGGVADLDVNALLRSSQPFQKRYVCITVRFEGRGRRRNLLKPSVFLLCVSASPRNI